jgi:CBS domain containing-hemolysin-like protein
VSPLTAILIALMASALASVCAYADGALLSIDEDHPQADQLLAALVGRRDRAHRALAFARVTLQLGAGVCWAIALYEVDGLALIPLLALIFGGILLVVLSETTARDIGERGGVSALHRTRGFIDLVERGLIAVVLLGEWIDATLMNLLPPSPATEKQEDETVERFRQVVAAEADVGTRGTSLLAGVFSLGDTTVAEVMTPRVDVVGVDRNASWNEVVAAFGNSEHSRLVVCEGDLDHIGGVIFAKDLLPFIVNDQHPENGWHSLVHPVAFIPASKRVDEQLRDFRAHRRHIAIVADEFGGTAGLVTIEDLLELIVGEIHDEYDVEEPEVESQGDRKYRVSGRLSLDQISELIGEDLRHDDVTTVGGLAYELFGRVPQNGESVGYRDWRLKVERVRRRRVERVLIEHAPAGVGAAEEPS